jgi:acyl-CoA reductase-like NAD-dependent aldehyde dehydrogenase
MKEGNMPQVAVETYKNYIGGKWVSAKDGNTFEDRNPANHEEILGIFPRSSAADVAAAVESARKAFNAWRLTPAPKRAEVLFRAAEILVKRKEEFAQLMTREMGKVLKEARGDVQEAIDLAYYAAGEGRRLFGQTTPSELPNKFAMSVRMPVGVAALITPWNFPMAIPMWKIAPALVCGNTVVFKPASDTPLCATKLVEVLIEAGLPEGVLNLVHGTGDEAGVALIRHPEVQLISFTGSAAVGQKVASIAAEGFKRVSLELGGKNCILVMEDANLDLAVDGAIWGAFGTSGQRCTASSRLIVHKDVLKPFTEKLLERTKKLRLGDGLLPTTDVGPVVNAGRIKAIQHYVDIGKKEAKLLCGGEQAKEGELSKGHFYQPTLFADVKPDAVIAQDEIFGPVTAIIPVENLEEAFAVANNVRYGLSSSIYTQDVNRAFKAMQELYTGIVYINSSTIGAEVHLPFGGTRNTGNGHREAGQAMLDTYTEWKTIYVDYSGKLQKAQGIE